eukprot:305126-Amphidinium_carterae.1
MAGTAARLRVSVENLSGAGAVPRGVEVISHFEVSASAKGTCSIARLQSLPHRQQQDCGTIWHPRSGALGG